MTTIDNYDDLVLQLVADLISEKENIKSASFAVFLRFLNIYQEDDLNKTIKKYQIIYHDYSYEKHSKKSFVCDIAFNHIKNLSELFDMLLEKSDHETYGNKFEEILINQIYHSLKEVEKKYVASFEKVVSEIEPLLICSPFNLYEIDERIQKIKKTPLISQSAFSLLFDIKEEIKNLDIKKIFHYEIFQEKSKLEKYINIYHPNNEKEDNKRRKL